MGEKSMCKEVGPGRWPTAEEIQDVLDGGRWARTTVDDVRLAFDCGREVSCFFLPSFTVSLTFLFWLAKIMAVFTIKCIGYDVDFQCEPSIEPPLVDMLGPAIIADTTFSQWILISSNQNQRPFPRSYHLSRLESLQEDI
jgi:hypothetical protein